jgi:NADPH:quinone reductase-like Zn-dependent oxidoreductase
LSQTTRSDSSLSDVPLQHIAAEAAAGRLDVKPGRVFSFDDIQEAHRVMEANQSGGKIVVLIEAIRIGSVRSLRS